MPIVILFLMRKLILFVVLLKLIPTNFANGFSFLAKHLRKHYEDEYEKIMSNYNFIPTSKGVVCCYCN